MSNKLHFITGGSRSGKSSYALELSQQAPKKCFIATAEAFDDEMSYRIKRHREERDNSYITIEEPIHVGEALLKADKLADVIIIDCLTVWVGNLMHHYGNDYPNFSQIDSFLEALQNVRGEVLIVSNELGMGLIPSTPMGRKFRDLAGFLNQRVARICGRATLVVSGIPMALKGGNDENL